MRLLRTLTAAIALGAAPLPTLACGNPLMWMVLYRSVPGSEAVHKAELAAREDGMVQSRSYTAEPGVPYHVWSQRSIERLFGAAAPGVFQSLAPGETLTILLVDEVAAVRFTGGADEAEFLWSSNLPRASGIDVLTTVNAVYSGWEHGLTVTDMADLGLVSVTSTAADRHLEQLFN